MTDRFAYVRDAELRDIIEGLDEVHSSLMGEALTGEYGGFYALADTIRMAVDYLVDLREQRNGGRGA